jgi:hypothetical protein
MKDNIFNSLSVIKSSVLASIRYVDPQLDGDRSRPYCYVMSLLHCNITHSTLFSPVIHITRRHFSITRHSKPYHLTPQQTHKWSILQPPAHIFKSNCIRSSISHEDSFLPCHHVFPARGVAPLGGQVVAPRACYGSRHVGWGSESHRGQN